MATVLILVWVKSAAWPARTPDPDFPSDLKYGIRWFTRNNIRTPGYDVPPPKQNAPTVILVHGWQPGTCQLGTGTSQLLVNFNYLRIDSKYGVNESLADAWLDLGYNVGIFYWTPFADEDRVQDAEDKIWSTTSPVGLRWRMNNEYHYEDSPNFTVPEMFVDSYLRAMVNSTFAQGPIRLLGHSLGSQIVARAVSLLQADPTVPQWLWPQSVILLDPFMSAAGKPYLGGGTVGAELVNLWKGVKAKWTDLPVAIFQSSNINFISGNGNSNDYTEFVKQAAMVRIYTAWISEWDMGKLGNQHVSAAAWYMKSISRKPVAGVIAPGAATPNADLFKLMGTGLYTQTGGGDTFDANDDVFTFVAWADPYTGPSAAIFIMVWIALFVMALVAMCMCVCCGCCTYRYSGKCMRATEEFDDTQDYTYRSASW